MRTTLRAPLWVSVLLGSVSLVYGLGVAAYWLQYGGSWVAIGLAALLVILVFGFASSMVTRLELLDDQIWLKTLLDAKELGRSEIHSVSWEKGDGVALKLNDSSWCKLPYLGNSQGVTNTLRAWLKSGS